MTHAHMKVRMPRTQQSRWWVWVAIGAAAVLAAIFLPSLTLLIAIVTLVFASVSLVRSTPTLLRLRSRTAAGGVAVAAAALIAISLGSTAAASPGSAPIANDVAATTASARPDRTPSQPPSPTPTPVVEMREEAVSEPIPFAATSVNDGTIPQGESRLSVHGANGERVLTYRVTVTDGVETARELVSDVVTREPVAEVTSIGTYVAPPPPPPVSAPATGCDPNYADGCVPIASDVDCAGGSGNGPAYFSGTARVVGSDIYDLDRDGDGIACDS